MRAFLNGRIDLTQAEAVRDLIDSQTLYQAQVAARQLEGALSKRLQPIKQKLVELIATMEAGVDFAEDDVSVIPDEQILARIAAIRAPLEELLASFAFGKVVHEGLTLAIVGRPNVGKSSLFNRLVEHERAIVTATPGTTRDLVSETVSIGGIPVRLVDTAGIRTALDEAESIGVRKSMEALAEADMALHCARSLHGGHRGPPIRASCWTKPKDARGWWLSTRSTCWRIASPEFDSLIPSLIHAHARLGCDVRSNRRRHRGVTHEDFAAGRRAIARSRKAASLPTSASMAW